MILGPSASYRWKGADESRTQVLDPCRPLKQTSKPPVTLTHYFIFFFQREPGRRAIILVFLKAVNVVAGLFFLISFVGLYFDKMRDTGIGDNIT